MKSPDVHDPVRLRVTNTSVERVKVNEGEDVLRVIVEFEYTPWWQPVTDGDVLWEHANALTCVRDALKRGGLFDDF